MKNNVSTKHHGNVMHILLRKLLAMMNKSIGPEASFNLTKLRKAISEQDAVSIDNSSYFDGAQQKSVKIPRDIIDDVTALIDKGIYYRCLNLINCLVGET